MSEPVTTEPATAPEAAPEQPAPARRRFAVRNLWQTAGPFAVFVVLLAIVAVLQPDFVGGGGLGILATQATSILLVALGQAMVLHVGSIDLSNAAIAIFAAVVLAALLWVLLRRTSVGQSMTAVGLNESGAIFAGIRTRWIKVLAFALSGLLAGVAGVMIIAQAGAASSFGLGSDLLLPGIAAAIVGGTAITGGRTNPLNVIFGALTITLIPIGAAAVGVPPQAQSLVYGLVIIIAVALTRSRGASEIVK